MERVPLYVDDMGETVFADDLRAGLFFIRLRAKQGIHNQNKFNRIKNRLTRKAQEILRRATAEQRAEDLRLHLMFRAAVDNDPFPIPEMDPPKPYFVPRTNRWNR